MRANLTALVKAHPVGKLKLNTQKHEVRDKLLLKKDENHKYTAFQQCSARMVQTHGAEIR